MGVDSIVNNHRTMAKKLVTESKLILLVIQASPRKNHLRLMPVKDHNSMFVKYNPAMSVFLLIKS